MFAPNQGFNPVGERQLVLTLAAGLTREEPARAPWRWLRRIARPAVKVQGPVEAESSSHGSERFASSRL